MTRWKPWRERSQVERVDLYVRESLNVLMWLVPALALFGLLDDDASPALLTVVLAGTVALGLASMRLLREAMALYPASTPLPARALATVVALGAAMLALACALPRSQGLGVALVPWSMVSYSAGGLRDRRVTGLLVAAQPLLLWVPSGEPWAAGYGLVAGLFFVFTVRSSMWLYDVVAQLDAARGAQASLAVAEERLRFSRDVHDVLGRRLATLGVQAELAAALADRGDPQAVEQMLQVRAQAHEGLRDARELARGYRPVDLAQELDGARSLLRAAGIACEVEVTGLAEGWHEAAAWVVREGVTNVLRHSRATTVQIRYADERLSVTNDGVEPTVLAHAPRDPGTGLTGLRERLAPLGATAEVTGDPGGHTLSVRMPGSGPVPRAALDEAESLP